MASAIAEATFYNNFTFILEILFTPGKNHGKIECNFLFRGVYHENSFS